MLPGTIRYSESFKLQVVSDIENGKFKNLSEAREHYGIRGMETIHNWLDKYGKNHLRGKIIMVQSSQDIDEKKKLKKRIKDLEKALADTQVKAVLNESYFKILCGKYGISDPEDFKKKLDTKL